MLVGLGRQQGGKETCVGDEEGGTYIPRRYKC